MSEKIEPKNYTGRLSRMVAESFRASGDKIERLESALEHIRDNGITMTKEAIVKVASDALSNY
jgi:hypothetical protein